MYYTFQPIQDTGIRPACSSSPVRKAICMCMYVCACVCVCVCACVYMYIRTCLCVSIYLCSNHIQCALIQSLLYSLLTDAISSLNTNACRYVIGLVLALEGDKVKVGGGSWTPATCQVTPLHPLPQLRLTSASLSKHSIPFLSAPRPIC